MPTAAANLQHYSEALAMQLALRDRWRRKIRANPDVTRSTQWDIGAAVVDAAETFFVSAPISRFLLESSTSLPGSVSWCEADLPGSNGFLYLDEPATVGGLRLRALSWSFSESQRLLVVAHPDNAPDAPLFSVWRAETPVGIDGGPRQFWTDLLTAIPDGVSAPLASAARMVRDNASLLPEVLPPELAQSQVWAEDATAQDVQRLLLTTWTFIQQRVAAETSQPADRITRRRLHRENPADEFRAIRIIYLRQTEPTDPPPEPVSPFRRRYHCRWFRKPHKRLQPCGPQAQERRIVWVKGAICGPRTTERDRLPLRASRGLYAVVR